MMWKGGEKMARRGMIMYECLDETEHALQLYIDRASKDISKMQEAVKGCCDSYLECDDVASHAISSLQKELMRMTQTLDEARDLHKKLKRKMLEIKQVLHPVRPRYEL